MALSEGCCRETTCLQYAAIQFAVGTGTFCAKHVLPGGLGITIIIGDGLYGVIVNDISTVQYSIQHLPQFALLLTVSSHY